MEPLKYVRSVVDHNLLCSACRGRKRGSIAETMGKGLWIGKKLATHRSYKEARETGEGHAKGWAWGWGE